MSTPPRQYVRHPQVGSIYPAAQILDGARLLVVEVILPAAAAVVIPVLPRAPHPTVRDVRLPDKTAGLGAGSYALTDMRVRLPLHRLHPHTPTGMLEDPGVTDVIVGAENLSKDELYTRSVAAGTTTGSFLAGDKGHLAVQRRALLMRLHSFAAG
jgi:hypothetical protein